MLEEFLSRFALFYSISALRYLLIPGGIYLLFYVWKRSDWINIKIQEKFPENKHIKREITYSLITFIVFSAVGALVYVLHLAGYTQVYLDITEYSWVYFIFSVVVFILAHDTYFYWTHRLMHHKLLYKHVHLIHHKSTNPTPWASFAFHPIEAVLEVGILPIMAFIMPVHPFAILLWLLYMTFMNVMGHCGFEIYPTGFTKGKFTKWHNTSVHHNMHHQLVTCNYGLYFNIWDKLMGTNHQKYHETFEAIKQKAGNDEELSAKDSPSTYQSA